MASVLDNLTNAEAMKFIDQVGEPFKTVPHLPKNIVDIFVKLAPWGAILGAVLGVLGGLSIFTLGLAGSALTLNPLFMVGTLIEAVIMLVRAVLLFMAFKPLQDQQMKGWIYIFWSMMLSVVSMVAFLIDGHIASIVGTVIGVLIGLYVLFEMRSSYGAVKAAVKKVEEVASK